MSAEYICVQSHFSDRTFKMIITARFWSPGVDIYHSQSTPYDHTKLPNETSSILTESPLKLSKDDLSKCYALVPVAEANCGWTMSPKLSTLKLFGPASLIENKVMIYPCEKFRCSVYCPCYLCRVKYQKISDLDEACIDRLYEHRRYHKAYHLECDYCSEIFKILPGFNFTLFVRQVPYQPHLFLHIEKGLSFYTKNDFKKCSLCDAQFTRTSDQLRHFKAVHTEESFVCDICERRFNRKDALMAHIDSVHDNCGGEFSCEDCGTEFSSYPNFKRHKMSRKEAKCNICEDVFCNSKVLKVHIKKEHELKCGDCQTSFARKSNLVAHTTMDKIPCNFCSSIFCDKRKLRVHLAKFHKQKHHCDYCGIEFTTKRALERHKETANPDVCKECAVVFCSNRALESHILYKHEYDEVYKFVCETCEETYPSKHSLGYHVRTQHSGESVLHCELCEFSFTDWGTFSTHKKTH